MPREYGAQRRSYLGWLRLMSITAAGLVFVVGCSTVEDPEATDAESAEVSETNADEEVNGDEDTDADVRRWSDSKRHHNRRLRIE